MWQTCGRKDLYGQRKLTGCSEKDNNFFILSRGTIPWQSLKLWSLQSLNSLVYSTSYSIVGSAVDRLVHIESSPALLCCIKCIKHISSRRLCKTQEDPKKILFCLVPQKHHQCQGTISMSAKAYWTFNNNGFGRASRNYMRHVSTWHIEDYNSEPPHLIWIGWVCIWALPDTLLGSRSRLWCM